MKKKIFKIVLITLLTIAIPAFIIIAVLFANNKELLHNFNQWIKQPGNLSTFIVGIGLYFPFVNGIWRLVINILSSVNVKRSLAKHKINKVKIYDDEKANYIYYDKKNNIIDCQFKASEDVDINKLVEMATIELKQKVKMYDNKKP